MEKRLPLLYLITRMFVMLPAAASLVAAQDFNVTGGNGIDYTIDGQTDPSFTLQRGVTYVFQLNNVAIHPFYIKSSLGTGSSGRFDEGVSRNGATSGDVTFAVPQSAPDTLFYQCGVHFSMNGTFNIVTPASPPEVKIVFIAVGDFVTLESTGTNGWTATPEYLCDPASTNWTEVPDFTNSFSNGTNVTTFPRPDPICGTDSVLLRVRNDPE